MVIQVDVGSRDHPKPISISESLSLTEREELIALIQEYIDIFAWNYEDMPDLDLQIAMHHLNIRPDVKPVRQQQRRFHLYIMEAIEAEVHKLIERGSYGKSSIRIGLLTLSPFLKRMKKSWSVLTTTILMQLILKMSSHYPSMMSWLTAPVLENVFYGWLLRV